MELRSPVLSPGGEIPLCSTRDGENLSPPLSFERPRPEAR